MKRIVTGLVIGAFLIIVPRAHASTIGVSMGAKYTCSVENCGTETNKALSSFNTVQQVRLSDAFIGDLSAMNMASFTGPIGPIGFMPWRPGAIQIDAAAASATPEPASLLLLGTGIVGLVIRQRRKQQ